MDTLAVHTRKNKGSNEGLFGCILSNALSTLNFVSYKKMHFSGVKWWIACCWKVVRKVVHFTPIVWVQDINSLRWVTHICISKLTTIGWDTGLSPGWHQAIISTNAGILLIQTLGTNVSVIISEIHTFSMKKMHLKTSVKWCPFCLSLNLSMHAFWLVSWKISIIIHIVKTIGHSILYKPIQAEWCIYVPMNCAIFVSDNGLLSI